MAKRGRKTKAQEQMGRARIAPPAGRYDCPGHLSGVAREAWGHLTGLLREAGNLERTDPTIIEAYCINLDVLRQAQTKLASDGVTVEHPNGMLGAHPCLQAINAATLRLKTIADVLGLVPASSKLASASKAAEASDKWGDLLGVVG